MSRTWNIVSKDFLRMRVAILAWAGLMALKILFYAAISGGFGSPSLPWLYRLGQGPLVPIRVGLEPLIAFILAGWLVFEDPLVGADAFWVTRPISGARLLGAKALGAALFLVLLPVLINVPWWLSCGFGPLQVARAMVPMLLEYSAVAVIGMGVASATTSFPRYFLWTIAGFAGLLAIHLMASELARSGLGFQATQTMETGLALTRFAILIACALLVSAEIGIIQFLSRHFTRILPLVAALTVIASAIAFSSRLNVFPRFGWDARETMGSEASAAKDSDINVSAPAGTAGQPSYDGYMDVPMRLTKLAPATAAFWRADAEWSDRGRSLWKSSSIGGHFQGDLMQAKIRSLVGFSPDAGDFTGDDNYLFPRSIALKYADKPLSFRAKVTLYVLKGAIGADMPIQEQSFKGAGSSYSVNDLVRGEHAVTMTVTDRFLRNNLLALFGVVWPRSVTWSLVNRAKGEMRTGREVAGSDWLGLQLNMVSVVSERISFADIASPSWLEGARLVTFDFALDHSVERSLVEEPFRYSYLSPEESRYRLRKAH